MRRATVAPVAVVSCTLIIVVGLVIALARIDPPNIAIGTTTTDAGYCTLVKAMPLAQVVDAATKSHDYAEVALGVLPNHGPVPVNNDVGRLRDQVSSGDYIGAASTAQRLDARTSVLCS